MANALDHLNAGRTRLEWLAQLKTDFRPARNYRRTSIICTIGELTLSEKSVGLHFLCLQLQSGIGWRVTKNSLHAD